MNKIFKHLPKIPIYINDILHICRDADNCYFTGRDKCRHKKPHRKDRGCSSYSPLCKCIPYKKYLFYRCPEANVYERCKECNHADIHKHNINCDKSYSVLCPTCIPIEETK